jgi:hypothetical protein
VEVSKPGGATPPGRYLTGYSKAGVDFNRWEGEAWRKARKTGNGVVDVLVLISRCKDICNLHADWCNNRGGHGLGNGDDSLFARTFRPGSGFSFEMNFLLRNYQFIQFAQTNCLVFSLINIQTYA